MEKYNLVEIKNIKNIGKSKELVYDISVALDHSYIANDIIVHNCGCLTSVHSSIHHPMASLIEKTSEIRAKISGKTKIIADGGIKTYSDAIKCLALGADYVMMGYTLSKCLESAGDFYDYNYQGISKETAQKFLETNQKVYKDYHGMSTKKVQAKILGVDEKKERHNLKTSEGRSEFTRIEYTLPGWTENFNSYLQYDVLCWGEKN